MSNATLPPSVNFHLLNACNYNCGFCFAVFDDSAEYLGKGQLPLDKQLAIVRGLAEAGVKKITFAGGEPTLSKNLSKLLAESKRLGMTTMVVTNGSRLSVLGDRLYPHLDWLVLSIDSTTTSTNVASGRAQKGVAMTADDYLQVARTARAAGVRFKLNTVVHQLNVDEDMTDFVRRLRPERWKVFQVLPVADQNGDTIDRFEITPGQFEAWLARHRVVGQSGVVLVPETNEDMRGTYAMIDPAGRFYDSSQGFHTYSRPILEVGVAAAFEQVSFEAGRYEERGGIYDWEKTLLPPFVALSGVSGSGKDTAAQTLIDHHGYRRIAIADPIKETCKREYYLTDEQLWGDRRNEVDPRYGVSPRALYQQLGDRERNLDADVWIRAWSEQVRATLDGGGRVVCTDIRTAAELEAARELGAVTVRLERPGAAAPGELAEHPTEVAVTQMGADAFDAVVRNDGTLDDLKTRLLDVLRAHDAEEAPAQVSEVEPQRPLQWIRIEYSWHSRRRMSKREVSEADVQYVLFYGVEESQKPGITVHRLTKPAYGTAAPTPYHRHLLGLYVVLDTGEQRVITVFRDNVARDARLFAKYLGGGRPRFTLADAIDAKKRGDGSDGSSDT